MTAPQMTEFQRSAQFWSVLVLAARTRQVVSYEMLAKMTGVPRFGQASILGNIYFYCEQQGLPPLTSIVIDEKNGRPAADDFQKVDVPAAHARVFVCDWLSRGSPSVQEFEQARAEHVRAAKAG
jgi:hypothetical protein